MASIVVIDEFESVESWFTLGLHLGRLLQNKDEFTVKDVMTLLEKKHGIKNPIFNLKTSLDPTNTLISLLTLVKQLYLRPNVEKLDYVIHKRILKPISDSLYNTSTNIIKSEFKDII